MHSFAAEENRITAAEHIYNNYIYDPSAETLKHLVLAIKSLSDYDSYQYDSYNGFLGERLAHILRVNIRQGKATVERLKREHQESIERILVADPQWLIRAEIARKQGISSLDDEPLDE